MKTTEDKNSVKLTHLMLEFPEESKYTINMFIAVEIHLTVALQFLFIPVFTLQFAC